MPPGPTCVRRALRRRVVRWLSRLCPAAEFAISKLERQPDFSRPRARFLCLEMRRRGDSRISRICIGGKRDSRGAAGFARITPAGKPVKQQTIPVKVSGTSASGLTLSFVPGRAHVVPGKYGWRVLFSTGTCDEVPGDCRSSYPRKGFARYRVRPVEIVGCTGGNGQVVRSGPGGKKLVALTFDDGPSVYTPQVMDVLRRKKVKATFFMLGDMVSRDPSTARRVLAAGHEVANHSSSHPLLPGYADISRASRTIRRATGFRPCLFRPPYGALNSSVVASVRNLGMKSVLWDVDTSDWSRPGTGTIRSRIRRGRPRLDHPHARRWRIAQPDGRGPGRRDPRPALPWLPLRDGHQASRQPLHLPTSLGTAGSASVRPPACPVRGPG